MEELFVFGIFGQVQYHVEDDYNRDIVICGQSNEGILNQGLLNVLS